MEQQLSISNKKPKIIWLIIILIVVTAIISGGIVYIWQQACAKKQIEQLYQQIQSLQSQCEKKPVSDEETRKTFSNTRRAADLGQLQLALELYYEDENRYPVMESDNNYSVSNLIDELGYFLDIPLDPQDSTPPSSYQYFTSDDQKRYILAAVMEGDSQKLDTDLDDCSIVGSPSACDCSDVNKRYCVGI